LSGSFLVSQEIIQEAVLESVPPHDWSSLEKHIQGLPFKQWKEHIFVH
jgi:hypothetical protein